MPDTTNYQQQTKPTATSPKWIWLYAALSLLWAAISVVVVVSIVGQSDTTQQIALGSLWFLCSLIVWVLVINVMIQEFKSLGRTDNKTDSDNSSEAMKKQTKTQIYWMLDPFRLVVLLVWLITTIISAYALQIIIWDRTSVIALSCSYGAASMFTWAFLFCVSFPENGDLGPSEKSENTVQLHENKAKDRSHSDDFENDVETGRTGVTTETDLVSRINDRFRHLEFDPENPDMVLHDLECLAESIAGSIASKNRNSSDSVIESNNAMYGHRSVISSCINSKRSSRRSSNSEEGSNVILPSDLPHPKIANKVPRTQSGYPTVGAIDGDDEDAKTFFSAVDFIPNFRFECGGGR